MVCFFKVFFFGDEFGGDLDFFVGNVVFLDSFVDFGFVFVVLSCVDVVVVSFESVEVGFYIYIVWRGLYIEV